jgi:hypothetical protein
MSTVQAVGERLLENVERVIIGKRREITLTLIGLLCQGHILIEDVPGVGKTMLAKSLARSIGCSFSRIQFTPDMLPSDVTGVSVFNQRTTEFEFRPGPVMAQIVLADEINRATPKTQSALLEAMARPTSWPGLSWCWLPRTRSSTRAPSPCPKRSLTASCCASGWAIQPRRTKPPCSTRSSTRTRLMTCGRWSPPMNCSKRKPTSNRCISIGSSSST